MREPRSMREGRRGLLFRPRILQSRGRRARAGAFAYRRINSGPVRPSAVLPRRPRVFLWRLRIPIASRVVLFFPLDPPRARAASIFTASMKMLICISLHAIHVMREPATKRLAALSLSLSGAPSAPADRTLQRSAERYFLGCVTRSLLHATSF